MDLLDEVDRQIVNELQKNPGIDMEDLRDLINSNLNRNLSISTIYHRRNKLLESNTLREVFVPDYTRAGKSTICFIAVKLEGHDGGLMEEFTKIPGVMEVHVLGGQYDILLKVRGRDIHDIADLVFRIRTDYPIVKTTEIFVVLKTVKETMNIKV